LGIFKLTALAATATVTLLSLLVGTAWAATPTPFFNGFETSTAGWFDDDLSRIVREPSGYTDNGGYANNVASATGDFHARLGVLDCGTNCPGPFTEWGGFTDTFPPGGYATGLAIYLDVDWAASHPDARFDWDVASNNAMGAHLRDFVFNAGTTPEQYQGQPGFVINASTNATREGADPSNRCPSPSAAPNICREPVFITTSGWYTFVHRFGDAGANGLQVDMSILDSAGSTVADWTIYPGDPIATVGGNRYGWFPNQEISQLAIDNSSLDLPESSTEPEAQVTNEPGKGSSAPPDCTIQGALVAREAAGVATARQSLRMADRAVAAAKRKLRRARHRRRAPARRKGLKEARRKLGVARSRRQGATSTLQASQSTLITANAALAACNAGLVPETFTAGLPPPGFGSQVLGGSSAVPGPPEFGRSVNIRLVSGTVLVRVPGSRTFRLLKAGEQIPIGSVLDTRNGRVRLTSAKYRVGSETQTADFYAGVFRVRQPPSGRPRTVLKLVDELATLRLGPAEVAHASRRRGGRRRNRANGLWGSGSGNFVSRGRHGSATVRGTIWFTQDRPAGTFFKVRRDTVLVRDFTRRRTIRLRAGQSYLAPAP